MPAHARIDDAQVRALRPSDDDLLGLQHHDLAKRLTFDTNQEKSIVSVGRRLVPLRHRLDEHGSVFFTVQVQYVRRFRCRHVGTIIYDTEGAQE
jgi:hypothetical protein